jgi:hypothetical protein
MVQQYLQTKGENAEVMIKWDDQCLLKKVQQHAKIL